MTTRVESIRGSRDLQYIREMKRVHKFDLMKYLGLSVSSFEKFKPWFLYVYGDSVKYDRGALEFVLTEQNL